MTAPDRHADPSDPRWADAYTCPQPADGDVYSPIRPHQLDALRDRGNIVEPGAEVFVGEHFEPTRLSRCRLAGRVWLTGWTRENIPTADGRSEPAGITDSTLINCVIGRDVAIHRVGLLAGAVVEDVAAVRNVAEAVGLSENWTLEPLEVVNESGGRPVHPFPGMRTADACLSALWPGKAGLTEAMADMADQACRDAGLRGLRLGAGACLRNVGSVRDAWIGPACAIDGVACLRETIVESGQSAPAHLGCGVQAVQALIGAGCRVDSAAQLQKVVLGQNVTVHRGTRLSHAAIGDNSNIACCEVLHSLVLPAHEQHHNNSFLIAASIGGQSNIAAGATVGSNHTSRRPDGEIHAGRGFWAGLCVSLKHTSRFASYTLIAKGSYPHQIDLPLPFSLLADDPQAGRLVVIPAFWWMYNAYALIRNRGKFADRDTRTNPAQRIEFDPLAPDTAEEILAALDRLDGLEPDDNDQARIEGVENSRRPVVVRKVGAARQAYRQMLHIYAVGELAGWLEAHPDASIAEMVDRLGRPRETRWANLGGQLVPGAAMASLQADISCGVLGSASALHARLDELWADYPDQRAAHALAVLGVLLGTERPDRDAFLEALGEWADISAILADSARAARAKDFDDPFRRMVYRDAAEQIAVLGTLDDDRFLAECARQADEIARRAEALKSRH